MTSMGRWVRLLALAVWIGPGAAAQVPSPDSFLGFTVGTDRKLADWGEITGYFDRLARASRRVKLDTLGTSTLGRPFILVTISSRENLKRLHKYREIQAKLADPRKISSPVERERLIHEGRVIVLITSAIHSIEVGSGQVPLRIAYRLATDTSEEVERIRERAIVLLIPSLNPDGLQQVADWYKSTLGQPWEGAEPPFLYHPYVGHDNNRDWYTFTQKETQLTVTKVHNVWHPQIVHDIHQTDADGARFFVPPWLDPVEPNVDPLIVSAGNALGTAIAWDMHAEGKVGIVVNAAYDAWTPSRAYSHYHAGIRMLTETASARMATPLELPFESLRSGLGFDPRERSWNFPDPWPGGTWRLADIVAYMEAGAFALLRHAARYREGWLRTFSEIGERAVRGRPGWPKAIVLPAAGQNPEGLAEVLRILVTGGVEVRRARAAFSAAGEEFPAGAYVVPLDQPYGGFAKALLELQHYPELRGSPGGRLQRPHDVTAHSIGLLMGVRAVHVTESVPVPLGDVVDPPVVRRVVPGLTGARAPRIGLYQSYDASLDEGWTRWIFDQYGVPYATLHDADVRTGGLLGRYDVVLLPSQSAKRLVEGWKPGQLPPQFTGGLGERGLAAIREFVEAGGTLITLNEASQLPLKHFDVPIRNALDGLARDEYYAPGSILGIQVDTRTPIGHGMPQESIAWMEGGPAFELKPGADSTRVSWVARFRDHDPLLSGWLDGGKYLQGKGALAVVRIGKGRIVLFGFRPQYRAQSLATYPLLFNALRAAVEHRVD
jgi:hypothetical protein